MHGVRLIIVLGVVLGVGLGMAPRVVPGVVPIVTPDAMLVLSIIVPMVPDIALE